MTPAERALQHELHRLSQRIGIPDEVRYFDPYDETIRNIQGCRNSDAWTISCNGRYEVLSLTVFPDRIRELLKYCFIWLINKYSPTTVFATYQALTFRFLLSSEFFLAPFVLDALDLKRYWEDDLMPAAAKTGCDARGLKRFLFFLSSMSLGCLDPDSSGFLGSFRGPGYDFYASVRSGDVFLSPEEELQLAGHFHDLVHDIEAGSEVDVRSLRDSCVLLCSFLHAVRPAQTAKVTFDDVKIRGRAQGANAVQVHIRFQRIKQLDPKRRTYDVRKIRQEWGLIFEKFASEREAAWSGLVRPGALAGSFFGLSPFDVSVQIRARTKAILGKVRSATDLRHTAAQRLVDNGATHDELMEFLGQSNRRTGGIYYRTSINQVERLNKALGSSHIYSTVADMHRTKSISRSELAKLPQESQIGGVAHGVPIAGIGQCTLGQSLCSKNPVLSCYGCAKFIAVRDVGIHERVRDTLQPVVRRFYDQAHTHGLSPAYTQLEDTINAVDRVIAEQASNSDGQVR